MTYYITKHAFANGNNGRIAIRQDSEEFKKAVLAERDKQIASLEKQIANLRKIVV